MFNCLPQSKRYDATVARQGSRLKIVKLYVSLDAHRVDINLRASESVVIRRYGDSEQTTHKMGCE